MKLSLLLRPLLLLERLGRTLQSRRRLSRLRGTPASRLVLGHIDSLELLDLARTLGVRVIYDIGANAGTWTLLARSVIQGARVEAFEPLEEHCDAFLQSTAGLEDVHLHPIGLGASSDQRELRITSFSDASSFLALTAAGAETFGVAEVGRTSCTIVGLDEFRGEHELPFPDLLKLDVQGFELEVLKGALEVLAHATAVIVEVSFREYYSGQCLFSDVCSFLGTRGFELCALSVSTPLGRPLDQADVLFVRAGRVTSHR